jgi:hypothetical protein
MQVISTGGYGELTFTRTWSDGSIHIGRLAEGGYCHIGGPPIASKRELETAIPEGKYLDEALDWWSNKDKVEVKKDKPKIVIMDDGSYALSDGSPIKSVGDLINYIPPGPGLDAAVLWYVETHRDKIESREADKEVIEQKTEETKEELAQRTCSCRFVAKNFTGLQAHKRTCRVHQAQEQKAA